MQLEQWPLLQGAAAPAAVVDPAPCRLGRRAAGADELQALAVAGALGQAARRHPRFHARHASQPGSVSAKWRTAAWAGLPAGDAGGAHLAIDRGGAALGERAVSRQRQRRAGAVSHADAPSDCGRHHPCGSLALHLLHGGDALRARRGYPHPAASAPLNRLSSRPAFGASRPVGDMALPPAARLDGSRDLCTHAAATDLAANRGGRPRTGHDPYRCAQRSTARSGYAVSPTLAAWRSICVRSRRCWAWTSCARSRPA